ncbi:hypothetical protein DFH08DRAFT_976116 [Mycena albidolilacea]|uniref:Uncharacterized protein n=1 Tax=Mycena albidolilacea TaxID=1033008 RepID=A0AAD7E9W3_9AGAR|nr:hypothetical protein DFH08DRAFT_976116 [Mycena albidolilacea]
MPCPDPTPVQVLGTRAQPTTLNAVLGEPGSDMPMMTDALLDTLFAAAGTPRATESRRLIMMERAAEMAFYSGGIPQAKPEEVPTTDPVWLVEMPNGPQPRGIRFFTGGSRLWFFDFYDTSIRAPLNAPAGYKVTVVFSTPSESRSWLLESVESLALGKEGIKPGAGRFSGTESVRCSLVRPGLPPFLFIVPDRIAPYDEPEFARAVRMA